MYACIYSYVYGVHGHEEDPVLGPSSDDIEYIECTLHGR